MKEDRREILADIITKGRLTSQAQIVAILRKKGFDVTQASVSRDLERIRARKRSGVYRIGNGPEQENPFGSVTFSPAGDSLVVARCGSGLASALAVSIDAMNLNDIVGTIAGDDTVFIAVSNRAAQNSVMRAMRRTFGG